MKTDQLSLVEQTQRSLLKYIVDTTSSINSQLPKEQEFADLLGVSRVVVREALSRLRALGLIETKRKKGTVVVVPEVFGVLKIIVTSGLLNKESLKDLYQLRLMLEIGMADFVFLNKTSAQMKQLDDVVRQEVELKLLIEKETDPQEKYQIAEELTSLDIKFHSILYEMAGNKSLMDFQHLLRHIFTLYTPHINSDYRTMAIVSHVGLYNLLCGGNADSFRMAMRLHLKTQFDNMDKILNKAHEK